MRQTVYHKRLVVALDQRLYIADKFCSNIVAVLVHPLSGNNLFVVGNGLCAYEIVDTSASGISQVNDDVNIGVVGNLLNLGTKAEQVSVYDVSGAMIATARDVTTMEMNLNKGVYIVKVVVDGTTIVKKIAIR